MYALTIVACVDCMFWPASQHDRTAKRAMTIAADCCVYTNHNFTVETLGFEETDGTKPSDAPTP